MATGESVRMKPWLRAVLVVSLALNLMVAGIVAGRLLMWGGGPPHHARLEQLGGPLSRALSAEDRQAIGQEMRRAFRADPAAAEARRGLYQALIVDLRAERFDREAVAGHLARQRGAVSERLSLAQGVLLSRLEAMSAQERAAFADRLEEALEKRRKRH